MLGRRNLIKNLLGGAGMMVVGTNLPKPVPPSSMTVEEPQLEPVVERTDSATIMYNSLKQLRVGRCNPSNTYLGSAGVFIVRVGDAPHTFIPTEGTW